MTDFSISTLTCSVSELRYRPPDVEVREAIEEASKRPEFHDMGTEEFTSLVQIPDYHQLVQQESSSNLIAMDHIKFVRKAITKVRSKHVNYLSKSITSERKSDFVPLTGSEVLLSIALYPPQSTSIIQEFLVLSTQPLSALKDVFYCLQDQAPVDVPANGSSDSLNVSGFFFIDDTFFVDSRNSENVDYATPIIKWMQSGSSPYWLGQSVKRSNMQDTKFEDLSIQIGKKYLYCHRAKCEHIIVVTDIRQFTASDDPNASSYPKQIFQARYRQRRCTVCDRTLAKWITSEDAFSIEDPSYYCSPCFDMAHKNEDGTVNQTGFKLLPYLHD